MCLLWCRWIHSLHEWYLLPSLLCHTVCRDMLFLNCCWSRSDNKTHPMSIKMQTRQAKNFCYLPKPSMRIWLSLDHSLSCFNCTSSSRSSRSSRCSPKSTFEISIWTGAAAAAAQSVFFFQKRNLYRGAHHRSWKFQRSLELTVIVDNKHCPSWSLLLNHCCYYLLTMQCKRASR